MSVTKTITFQPFVKFIIDFHNNLTLYGRALKVEFTNLNTLEEEEIFLLEESFLVKIAAEWETLTHNIIAYCIAMDTSALSKYLELTLPTKLSFDNAYSILNGLQYKTITSSNELRGLTRKILVDEYNPFTHFDKSKLSNIDDLYAFRNYVAHKSQRSRERLLTMYRNRYITENFVAPGSFLATVIDTPNGITRRDLLYGALLEIAVDIWKYLDLNSYSAVYEDDTSEEGFLNGLSRMREVFQHLTESSLLI